MVNGFVFIIESPSEFDILDGRTEGRTLCEALRLAGTDAYYSLSVSKEMFQCSLTERLSAAYQNFHKFPIIHISAHGDENGIALTNGDYIPWDELRAMLSPLNKIMQGGLLICMSSCFGASGCRMAMHEDDELPFWALIGHHGSAGWSDAAVAYVSFYHNFFKGKSVEASVAAMCSASGDNGFLYRYGRLVKEGWAQYMNEHRRQSLIDVLLERTNEPPQGLGATLMQKT